MQLRQKHLAAIATAVLIASVAIPSLSNVQTVPNGYVQGNCPDIVQKAVDTVSAKCNKAAW